MTRRQHVGIAVGGFAGQFMLFATLLVVVAISARRLPPPTNALGMLRAFGAETSLWEAGGLLIATDRPRLPFQAVLATIAALAGGFLAARISRVRPMLTGALSSWLLVGLAVVAALRTPPFIVDARVVLVLGLMPCMGALGGAIGCGRLRFRRDVSALRGPR
jgi:hypothetical protein